MQRKQDELVPIGDALSGMGGPVQARRETRRGLTVADQVDQLAAAREADPEIGFMARLLVLCSLPRTNPGNRLQYKRANGPYSLIMTAVGKTKFPYGSLPRLLIAWICTEAVKTQSRELLVQSRSPLGRKTADELFKRLKDYN